MLGEGLFSGKIKYPKLSDIEKLDSNGAKTFVHEMRKQIMALSKTKDDKQLSNIGLDAMRTLDKFMDLL